MALSEGNNSIEGEVSSFPRLRMFVPVLLAGAAKLLKAAGKRAVFRHFQTRSAVTGGTDIPWVWCRSLDGMPV